MMGRREAKSNAVMSNAVYDTLKWVAQIALPAAGALYFGLSDLWDLPKALEVVGTVAVVDTFLGALLGLSNKQYTENVEVKAGTLDVKMNDGLVEQAVFNADMEPEEMAVVDKVIFTVNRKNV